MSFWRFWRTFGKGVFIISLIVCLGLAVYVALGQRYIGIVGRVLVFAGGLILVMILHTIFGMFIEMCDNIAEIKEKTGNNNTSPYRPSSYMNGSHMNNSER